MHVRPVKLSPKKGGHGHVTSYSVNLGSLEVRSCGFLDDAGMSVPLEKVIDPEKGTITIRKIEEKP